MSLYDFGIMVVAIIILADVIIYLLNNKDK